ncbi:MAG: RNA 2',3'-cyclic phosphodiesterase [Candidatus Omnitrophica bacterium]|nr:RNA 2',3'-cyclic phosphodiesterase [Candidatus Omnitrophota bacterium]
MNDKIRCFIAIELSKEIKQALEEIESKLQETIRGVKWVNPDNIHLTLKFLGNIEASAVEDIKKILDGAASGAGPFKIKLSNAGAFPDPARPRVIWIGIDEGTKESTDLADLIEQKAEPLGIEKEGRPFHPHLTLARVKFLKDRDSVKNAFTSLKVPHAEMTAPKITLFQSNLTPQGAVYTPIHQVELKK